MTLRVHTPPGPRLARLPFPAPLTGPDQARPVLIELLQRDLKVLVDKGLLLRSGRTSRLEYRPSVAGV